MRRLLIALLVVLAALGGAVQPAAAHNVANPTHYDTMSYLSCAAKRYSTAHTVDYSWPVILGPGVLVYNCSGHEHFSFPPEAGGTGCFFWKWQVARYANGTLVGGNYSLNGSGACPA